MTNFNALDRQAMRAWRNGNGTQAEDGIVEVFRRHHPHSTRRRYASLKKFLVRHPATGFICSYLLFELVVDPLLKQLKTIDVTKRQEIIWQILEVYLEFDRYFEHLNAGDEQRARWRRIKKAYRDLSGRWIWDLFDKAVSKSIRLGRKDHWILIGISPTRSMAGFDLIRAAAMVAAHRAVAKHF